MAYSRLASFAMTVALLAEGVDRNHSENLLFIIDEAVALLAEGVDRNVVGVLILVAQHGSPSSRRAWIEIGLAQSPGPPCGSRPPSGGRG